MSKTTDFKHQKNISEMISEINKPPILPETGWYKVGATELSTEDGSYVGIGFENGWDNLADVSNPDASWYLSEDGEVRLKGRVTGGSEGTVIFTLPEEVRPKFVSSWVCAIVGGGTANVEVYPDGSVYLESFN